MKKIVGLARKSSSMTHDEAVKYHREVHAPWGKRLLNNRGFVKYYAYYVDEAYAIEGSVLAELPWDLIVPEWYTDEGWEFMMNWGKTDPEGIKLMADLRNFSDHKTGIMLTCKEEEIVSPKKDSSGVNVIVLARKRSDMSHEECVKYHMEVHSPKLIRALGPRLKKCVAHYVNEAFSLEKGVMPIRPYDIVVVFRIESEFWANRQAFSKTPEGIEIVQDEENFIDRKGSIALVCQENIIIS
jgi:hypothetical protein